MNQHWRHNKVHPAHLISKVSYIRIHHLETLCSALSQRLRFRLADCISIIRPPESILSILSIDLAYMTSRHWRWADTEIFSEIYTDYLCAEFSLERSFAEIAHFEACALAKQFDGDLIKSDRRGTAFLRYLLLLTMAHQDTSELANEVGFGQRFFTKLAATLKNSDDSRQGSSNWNFPDSISVQIERQVEAIANSMQNSTWCLAAEILRLRIYEYNRTLEEFPSIEYGNVSIKALIALHHQRLSDSEARYNPWSPENQRILNLPDSDHALLAQTWAPLTHSQLIYQVGNRKRGNHQPFELTDYGEWIVALALSSDWIIQNQVTVENIVALPRHLQIEVIRALPRQNIPVLVGLLTEAVNAAQPAALSASVEQVAKYADSEKLAALIQCSLKLCKSPWAKAALCRSLGNMRSPIIGQLLKEMADSDESHVVRDAALGAILTRSW